MPRKPHPPLPFVERMRKITSSALLSSGQDAASSPQSVDSVDDIESLEARVKKILSLVRNKKKEGRMLFLVMYDIRSNKVRTLVHKYLKRQGCTPIQRSIFLADTSIEIYNKIKSDLVEVQQAYENNDSIIVLPVTTDYLRMMKIIGKSIELDIITHSKSTLFF